MTPPAPHQTKEKIDTFFTSNRRQVSTGGQAVLVSNAKNEWLIGSVTPHCSLATLLATCNGLHWAPLVTMVAMVFSTLPVIKAAVDPATMARLNALLISTVKVRPLLRLHAGMIAALYPWLGRRLLMKAPKFGPKMRLPASRA